MSVRSGVGSQRIPTAVPQAVRLLQVFTLALMLVPSNNVIPVVGAAGFPGSLAALLLLTAYVTSVALGMHDPLRHRHPVRTGLWAMWVITLLSYANMQMLEQPIVAVLSADRWLMQLGAMSGVALTAAEFLPRLADVRVVVRTLVTGGAMSGLIAALQFYAHLDLTPYLGMIPGFTQEYANEAVGTRGALPRVAGTALSPIELGVVAGMLIPLALHLALYDTTRSAWRRWLPVACIAAAVSTSVSRSAVVSVGVSMAFFVGLMPAAQRRKAMLLSPAPLVVIFMTSPGLIRTLITFFGAGRSDSSINTRVDDYPMVVGLVSQAPLLGHGGGSFLPDNVFDILDNQYLKTAIELGLLGLVVLILYFLLPVLAALICRRHSADPELRLLAAALAGASSSAALCSFTFDSLSFPMFALVQALVAGLVGACWRLVFHRSAPASPWGGDAEPGPVPPAQSLAATPGPRSASWTS